MVDLRYNQSRARVCDLREREDGAVVGRGGGDGDWWVDGGGGFLQH